MHIVAAPDTTRTVNTMSTDPTEHLSGNPEIFVDYSRFGRARHLHTQTWHEERAQLRVGQIVTVIGDSVDPAPAVITAIDDTTGRVDLDLLDTERPFAARLGEPFTPVPGDELVARLGIDEGAVSDEVAALLAEAASSPTVRRRRRRSS